MKKITILIVAVIALCFTACSSNSEEAKVTSLQSNELIVQGKEFAHIHNECLASIYNTLVSSKTRVSYTPTFSKESIINAANKYLSKRISKTRGNGNETYINGENYTTTTEDIRNKMSEYEATYVDRVLSNNVNNDKILEEIANDKKLTDSKKRALICFAATYKASSEYWQQNIEKWEKENAKTPSTRSCVKFNVKEFATADAYWAYTGMLFSGMNWIVGAGSAAVGSAFTCLK